MYVVLTDLQARPWYDRLHRFRLLERTGVEDERDESDMMEDDGQVKIFRANARKQVVLTATTREMASAFASSSTSPLPANVPGTPTRYLTSKYLRLTDLTVLQNASRVLHEQFASDAQIIPDLGETLNTRQFLSEPYKSDC